MSIMHMGGLLHFNAPLKSVKVTYEKKENPNLKELLGFLQTFFKYLQHGYVAVIRHDSLVQLLLLGRMLQGTTKLPWKFSHHPAAAGTFFTVMLLGLKFCTCQYEGSLQNVRLGIQLLEDGIYRAALGWFAYEPEWFEHDHGNFAHIEAQFVNSFVHYLQNDPKALGGEYGGSFLDMVRHRYCYLSCCVL
uniref:PI4-kinase N-terminal domain-containing protein n=1 Tax=Lactuca sativa TaxID=4236 RepID=A0A9R1V647_LACSA|nr:hypothetical protein LSAT_V11C600323770 [Lactuca sativa]